MQAQFKILFVCLGNIVRSPLAENIFRTIAAQHGLSEKYYVDSAGTSAYHVGEMPDLRMRQTAAEFGLEYEGRARQLTSEDLVEFDLIVAMDESNKANILKLAQNRNQQIKITLLRDFDPSSLKNASVPDPYYGGMEGFYSVYKIVERACTALYMHLENESSAT